MSTATRLLIYTDGSCVGNPGPGGWGAVVQWIKGDRIVNERELCGGDPGRTTNNRMEMQAAISTLRAMKIEYLMDGPLPPITLRSDSNLLIKGMTEWLPGWKRRGWRKADGKPVENAELWQQLAQECCGLEVTWEWVRGHAKDPINNRADALARQAAERPSARFDLPTGENYGGDEPAAYWPSLGGTHSSSLANS
nr:ribonuclease HI [Devosia sp. 1566]